MSDKSKKREDRKEKINNAVKEVKHRAMQRVKPLQNAVTSNRLKLLVTIVNRNKTEYFLDLIQSFEVNTQFVALANGTADAKMLNLLGIADTDKSVIFSIIQENKIPETLSALEEKFNSIKGGKGVACTVTLSSVIGTLIYGFLSNNKMAVKEN